MSVLDTIQETVVFTRTFKDEASGVIFGQPVKGTDRKRYYYRPMARGISGLLQHRA